MLESAIAGLMSAIAWPAIGFLFLGIVLGIYFGAVPGLSGLTGMAILLPFTFGMDPVAGATHFEVPVARGFELMAQLRRELPGFGVPRYVREVIGAAHKVELELDRGCS